MLSRLNLLRDYLLILQTRFSQETALPPCHPNRLPSFEPLLWGFATVLTALQVLSGVSPLLWLAPVLLVWLTLYPPPKAIAQTSLVLWAVWLLLSWDGMMTRQLLAIGITGLLSPLVRRILLDWEWQSATQTTLANLTQHETAATPKQIGRAHV